MEQCGWVRPGQETRAGVWRPADLGLSPSLDARQGHFRRPAARTKPRLPRHRPGPMASSTSRGVARTPGAIPPSRTARGITPGAQYALSPFVTDARLFRQLRAPPHPRPLHACPELTRRRPRREPHAGSRGYRPAAAPPPPRPSSRGSARPAPAHLPIMRMAAGPARGAHMLARRAGPCAAMARCPPPGTARPARGLADGSRVGAGGGERSCWCWR